MTAPLLATPGLAERAAPFVDAAVLSLGDLHVVDRLGRRADVDDVEVLLGLAFVVRAPRFGHTGVDPTTLRAGIVVDEALALAWPDDGWHSRAPMASLVGGDDAGLPFVRLGALLQTGRMAAYERRLAAALTARAGCLDDASIDVPRARTDLDALFDDGTAAAGDGAGAQKIAAAVALVARTTVVSGGPGTGKTTTLAKLLTALHGQSVARGAAPPHVALAAPTGKAAARMREALLGRRPERGVSDAAWTWLGTLEAVTLHRLLGFQPRTPSRFRHGALERLPHDVVVVDEASMVDVAMMCKLVEAVRDDARLVLLGDRNQLASVEAGCVLADLTAPAAGAMVAVAEGVPARLAPLLDALPAGPSTPVVVTRARAAMVQFRKAFRFEREGLREVVHALAEASADTANEASHLQRALARIHGGGDELAFRPHAAGRVDARVLEEVAREFRGALAPLRERPGDEGARRATLQRIDAVRVLCAHRAGPLGASGLNDALTARLRPAGSDPWWCGRLVMVTENDYDRDLWNGDVGVVAPDPRTGASVVFLRGEAVKAVPVTAMPAHETAFAMTIHKSQGSQFGHALVVLPAESGPMLTRELVYTGISRARSKVTLCGDAGVLADALRRRVERASGLGDR